MALSVSALIATDERLLLWSDKSTGTLSSDAIIGAAMLRDEIDLIKKAQGLRIVASDHAEELALAFANEALSQGDYDRARMWLAVQNYAIALS